MNLQGVDVVEKAKALWQEWVPGWLPIVLALCWVGMQYQRVNDRLDSLEKQMQDLQQYQRSEHRKTQYNPPKQDYDGGKQDAQGWPTQ